VEDSDADLHQGADARHAQAPPLAGPDRRGRHEVTAQPGAHAEVQPSPHIRESAGPGERVRACGEVAPYRGAHSRHSRTGRGVKPRADTHVLVVAGRGNGAGWGNQPDPHPGTVPDRPRRRGFPGIAVHGVLASPLARRLIRSPGVAHVKDSSRDRVSRVRRRGLSTS
jgi:hypothetical protein